MHASVYVRPIRKPPDFDWFNATVRSAAAHNFKETFEAGQRSSARIRPLQQGANTFSCGVFRRLEQEAGQQSPAAGLCMILERASHRIHQKFMIFRSLETCNRHRIQRQQQQQQVYVNDALTFQFSGIFMPQLADYLLFQTECSKLAARPMRKPPFQSATFISIPTFLRSISCNFIQHYISNLCINRSW
jgi:hypothetical protein